MHDSGAAVVPDIGQHALGDGRAQAGVGRIDLLRDDLLDLAAERVKAEELVGKLRIRAASLEQEAVNLSGGNQQKVVLASSLDRMVL